MSIFLTPVSAAMMRHSNRFINRRVLFAGDLQDTIPAIFTAIESRAHTQQYHRWQPLNLQMGNKARFSLTLDPSFVTECDTLIYYWPKNKQEAQFQLSGILALLPIGTNMFIIGENHSGVRSAKKIMAEYTTLRKIDGARRCSLYHGRLDIKNTFYLRDWWQTYRLQNLVVKTLPGVFGHSKLDTGSALLISTLETSMQQAKILDIGCGSGVIAAVLAKLSPKVQLTLSDVSAPALESSRATLAANGIEGNIIISNMYSNITGLFDMIISNPPFHDGRLISLASAEALFRGALKHLPIGGRLRIVANAFLPYPGMLNAIFGSHEVIAQNRGFKVYQTIVRSRPHDSCNTKQ